MKNKIKKILMDAMKILLLLILIFFIYNHHYSYTIAPKINDLKVEIVKERLERVVWPEGTELIKVQTYCGSDADHRSIEIWVFGLLKTDKNYQELELFLRGEEMIIGNYYLLSSHYFDSKEFRIYFGIEDDTDFNDYFVVYSSRFAPEQRDYRDRSCGNWPLN